MDYPPRHCIVCSVEFTPHRIDQIFCSFKEVYTCSDNLRRAERNLAHLFVKALVRQDYRCYGCGFSVMEESGGLVTARKARLSALLLTPTKAAGLERNAIPQIEPEDMAASCLSCRRNYYLSIATR